MVTQRTILKWKSSHLFQKSKIHDKETGHFIDILELIMDSHILEISRTANKAPISSIRSAHLVPRARAKVLGPSTNRSGFSHQILKFLNVITQELMKVAINHDIRIIKEAATEDSTSLEISKGTRDNNSNIKLESKIDFN